MALDPDVCERARLTRDARFDGRFFICVVTTGVYCRPVCPVHPPKAKNVRFYPSAAAAQEAGFRPCLRCRPESAPGSPAWRGTSTTVARAMRLLEEGAVDDGGVEALADRLGIGARQLRRVFVEHLGAPPVAVAQTRRLHFAKKLIDDTSLSMSEVAFAAGYGSVRRFNEAVRAVYGRSPTSLRRGRAALGSGELTLRLGYRPPFDWPAMIEFLRERSVAGIERVEGETYRRTLQLGTDSGVLSVTSDGDALAVTVHFSNPARALEIAARARRMFDLHAEPQEIAALLGRDPLLRPLVRASRGLRVPGAWDGFELAVRAVLGQQVTVGAARNLAGRLVSAHGRPLRHAATDALCWLFPTPGRLARADLGRLGVPRSRARAVRLLAVATLSGRVAFDGSMDAATLAQRLVAIEGIGPWTAEYVVMRALGEPDAFPVDDAGVRRALGMARRPLERRADAWRPWRAYAVVHLWRSLAGAETKRKRVA